jgi:hypothetical protein
MSVSYRPAIGASVLLGLVSGAAIAAGDLSRQTPTEVTVTLGSPGGHEFALRQLRFETGKLYKLILRNDRWLVPVAAAAPPICAATSRARSARPTPTSA